MASTSQIVFAGVDDDSAAQDRVGAKQRDTAVGDLDGRGAVASGGDVAEVARVPLLVRGATMRLSRRVPVAAARHAAVGGVAELKEEGEREKQEKKKKKKKKGTW